MWQFQDQYLIIKIDEERSDDREKSFGSAHVFQSVSGRSIDYYNCFLKPLAAALYQAKLTMCQPSFS